MTKILAYETKKNGRNIRLSDSDGFNCLSADASEILSTIVKQPSEINVTYDAMSFYQPIFSLLPSHVVNSLMDGKAAYWLNFRLWFGITRHGRVIGIKYNEPLGGNQFQKHEKEIYEIKQYYEQSSADLQETVELTQRLLSTLNYMGLPTKKLTSASTIYKEEILDKMALPSLLNMKEQSDDTHELALNNIHEWVADYKSVPDDKGIYSYDLTAAYAAALSDLPNLHWVSYYEHLNEIPPGCFYGVMQGVVHNKTLVSPLVEPESGLHKVGYWEGTMNTWEYGCCMQWGIADFKIKEGWFIYLGRYLRPFDYSMKKLYSFRNENDILQNNLAKKMAVSVWGKFLEMHGDDYGDYFNPIYADMVTSSVRIKVADFIYRNKIQDDVVSVRVDGVRVLKNWGNIMGIGTDRRFGEWRIN